MEATVREYEMRPSQVQISLQKRVSLFLYTAGFAFALRWSIDRLLHWPHESLFREVLFSLLLAAGFAFRAKVFLQPFSSGTLVLAENFVEGCSKSRWFTVKRRIYRDKIRSITENKRGLLIMDRGEFAARMLGFVFVPATLPQYREIRATLAGWSSIMVKS